MKKTAKQLPRTEHAHIETKALKGVARRIREGSYLRKPIKPFLAVWK